MYGFIEPQNGKELFFALIPADKLIIPEIQREVSDMHVKRLADSIVKIGFIEPITVVQVDNDCYEILNGQHRYHAGKMVNIEYFPAIIVPKELKEYILYFNIEKSPNLRDKAHQAKEIFHNYLSKNPEMNENELCNFYENAYYVTIGIAIEEMEDKYFPASAFERFLQRFDDFLDMSLREAYEERKKRAKKLHEAKNVLNQRFRELGLTNTQYKGAIVSRAMQMEYGRKRLFEEDFYTAIEKLKENIRKVEFYAQTGETADIEL